MRYPEVRKGAFTTFGPDTGPLAPHPTAGAVAVGARPLLVAYNLWLADADLATARWIAGGLRGPAVRALGLAVGDRVQVSMNLIDPTRVGPAQVWDAVADDARIERAELVGLLPTAVLTATPPERWTQLALSTGGDDRDPSRAAGVRRGRVSTPRRLALTCGGSASVQAVADAASLAAARARAR